jgi:hydrogenase maturation factor HypE
LWKQLLDYEVSYYTFRKEPKKSSETKLESKLLNAKNVSVERQTKYKKGILAKSKNAKKAMDQKVAFISI